MDCQSIQDCISELDAYCNAAPSGKALLVNTENYDVFQTVLAHLETDSKKKCIYVSDTCKQDGLPPLDEIPQRIQGSGCHVLVGYSQAAMLMGEKVVENGISRFIELPVRGHSIVLLDHCEWYLRKRFSYHPDMEKRILLLSGIPSPLPRIRIAKSEDACISDKPLKTLKDLFRTLEHLKDKEAQREISVLSSRSPGIFQDALYSVSACDTIYESLRKRHPEIASGTTEECGTDAQWRYLAEQIKRHPSLSALVQEQFGSADYLSSMLKTVVAEKNKNKFWLLWLSMKVMGVKGNEYLSRVLAHSKKSDDLEYHIWMDILRIRWDDPLFRQCSIERRCLLDDYPENLPMLDQFCSKVGIHEKNALWYLSDSSEKEKLEFINCLSMYEYTEGEIIAAAEFCMPELYHYLQTFTFNNTNTPVPNSETSLWNALTDYFHDYKLQKVTNHIWPNHMERVQEYASKRPYNMLQPRASIVKKMDKTGAQLYFFDALGAEYLAYILSLCQKYDLIPEVSVAHCELPSITTKNKDFFQFFPDGGITIGELDELKHHCKTIDYQKCKVPVHIFDELSIIDGAIRNIQSALKQNQCQQAIVVSDHGSSRLAVIYEQENPKLELEQKGQHSGRCCPAAEDPHIPYASYWDGYSILANYDRFRGGRKANLEVHGGASLEEMVVPVLVLTLRPEMVEIQFTNHGMIKLKGREPASIVVFSNIPLREPKLMVNGKLYQGQLEGDNRHARFIMPEFKRTKDYTADFYDGEKKLAEGMVFHVRKGTQEQEMFRKKPF